MTMTSMSIRQFSTTRFPRFLINKVGILKTFSTQAQSCTAKTKGKGNNHYGNGTRGGAWATTTTTTSAGGFAAAAAGLSLAGAASVTLMEADKRRKKDKNKVLSHYPQPATMVPKSGAGAPTTIPEGTRINSPPERPDLPIFTREEVAEHCDEDSLWYSFRGGVYDLTAFYQGHPGGAPVSNSVCLVVFVSTPSLYNLTLASI